MAAHESVRRPFFIDALHIFALCGFAIAQPLYATLSKSPEFLVAYKASQLQIIAIAAALSFGLPLGIICIEAFARLISERARRFIHVGMVSILLLTISIQVVSRIPTQSAILVGALALTVTAGASVLYIWSASTRRAVTFLSIGAVFFPLNFAFLSPVSKIFQGLSTGAASVDASGASTPVVMIILDEFNPTALLDRTGAIDAVRYPNFAELSHTATWFSRATSVHPHTQFAVPAILTGKMPSEADNTPTFNAHPKNLFSLLGGHYAFHVVEPLTSLCPQWACRDQNEGLDYRSLVSDLIIVFSHVIIPQSIARDVLPPLNEGWKAFGRSPDAKKAGTEQALVDLFNKQANRSRIVTFNEFVAQIDSAEKKLHFLHILLPHQPYQFFPDGTSYQNTPDTGTGEWPTEQHIIATGYHRYMTQLGLVDRLLGTLVSRLREIGIFDRSLIVLTGDHGRAFKAGHASRELDSETIDLLHTPLFVKFPHQTEGLTNHSLVSTLDILPTIIDALGIKTDWNFDGRPLTGTEAVPEKTISVLSRGQRFELSREDITRLPLLDWQIKTFGDAKTISDTSISTPYQSLVGKSLSTISIHNEPGATAPALSQSDRVFSVVDTKSGFLPALLSSEVKGLSGSGEHWLAIALNDRIAAVTPVFKATNGQDSVLVLLPEKYFSDGRNRFRAFLIHDLDKEVALSPIRTASRSYAMESNNDSLTITSVDGKKYKVHTDRVFGYVDEATADGRILSFAGWSADVQNKSVADLVVVFEGERSICVVSADIPRPDVARVYDAPELVPSGFNESCPLAGQSLTPAAMKFIGISEKGEAGIIRTPNWK